MLTVRPSKNSLLGTDAVRMPFQAAGGEVQCLGCWSRLVREGNCVTALVDNKVTLSASLLLRQS